ncbi:hypothetical protein CPAR01_02020 [Colletotrichum paranaense]|uniref:Tautomerase cis-CaaD-like domain-containing protein n=1 Tax=Colletotrichum paranaense TaxID=1914294 RepID=A0ABQ9SYC1_9PEZI|nr:uncharacterized protein CPAR01_02020 [Colletotrichum paranaense]KAK1544518.1 hypothetical protein CPAR01_02020 [Colletotrichum paranaense]
MPLYEVSHATPLSQGQRDQLAESITAIHNTKFTVPRMFINVIFTDSSNIPTYVGGKQEDFSLLCYEIRAAWAQIVHPETADEGGKLPPQDLELRSVFITGELIAGLKASFPTPSAGDELAWAGENYAAFKERAEAGDEDFADLVAEIQSWPEFEF